MSERYNAVCAICGTKYHVCRTCGSTMQLKPWRTITDTPDCYKIYMAVHGYTRHTITKEEANVMLENCTMPDTVPDHVKIILDEIMHEST